MHLRTTAILSALLVSLAASASAITLNFASLQKSPPDSSLPGALTYGTTYTQQGVVVASIGGRFDVWKLGNANFPGTSAASTSLFEIYHGAETQITYGSNKPFTLNSIDFAPLLSGASGTFTFVVTGVYQDSSFVTQQVTVSNSLGLQTVNFTGFKNVLSVNFLQGTSSGYFQGQQTAYQFNNIVINSTPVTFTDQANFNSAVGTVPQAGLVQATDGNFYGTTQYGGPAANGEVFKITPAGTISTVYNFCSLPNCADGSNPVGSLTQASDGNLYGMTPLGGTENKGTVFKIAPSGQLTTIYNFCSLAGCMDGDIPKGSLIQATDGNFYGTTSTDGKNGAGTIFHISSAGAYTKLYDFCSVTPNCQDGGYSSGTLVQATDGNFYGTTPSDSVNSSYGTVFKLTAQGVLTTLHTFHNTDGSDPQDLVQATNGSLYGTTTYGGDLTCSANAGCGTVFKITTKGQTTTLHSFSNTDGGDPASALVQGTDGNLYGTTSAGGNQTCNSTATPPGCGTVFKITAVGNLTTLHQFQLTDGAQPVARVMQATNGNFYGTTSHGGDQSCDSTTVPPGCGAVFSLSVGRPAFVETVPTSGKVGAAVTIMGYKLTGATSVTFNGKAANFTVVSSTEITTTVPANASTGKIKVKTPSRMLTSNVNFRVTP